MTLREYIVTFIDKDLGDQPLPFSFSGKTFEKNEVIIDYREIENNVYFLRSGIVQISLQEKDEERILDFFFSGSFFCSYSSLLTQTPSDVQILSLTKCEVDVIKHSDLIKTYDRSLLTNKLGRIATEKLYLRRVKREKDFLTKSAKERYKVILAEQPEIISQIPINKIAFYLGIRPESLSRIRKQIIS